MDAPQQKVAEFPTEPASCGTLGPGSGCAPPPPATSVRKVRGLQLLAMLLGCAAALLVSTAGGAGVLWGKIAHPLLPKSASNPPRAILSRSDFIRQKPQQQAEILLERAVARTDGATDQIALHVDGWRGKLQWDAQMSQLTTAALNSHDDQVRSSGVEVQLAAYGLSKNDATVDALVRQANSADRSQRIWALWSLGLLANRGIQTGRVVAFLSGQEKDPARRSDARLEEDRRWAVEGLALIGTDATIAPLLDSMRNDPSATVRERAACSLAEAGMLSAEQRRLAVPQLIDYSEDAALDAQTRAWAFQALGEITNERLPNDSAAWREWYRQNRGE
jgi:hypothetical protein